MDAAAETDWERRAGRGRADRDRRKFILVGCLCYLDFWVKKKRKEKEKENVGGKRVSGVESR